MADFLTSLFNSILTPGPTPTLVVATNVAFATLQLLLFVLIVVSRSIHFVVLSVLCAGLWWAINWFVSELEASKVERSKDEDRGKEKDVAGEVGRKARRQAKRADRVTGDPESSGTETEDASMSGSAYVPVNVRPSTGAGGGVIKSQADVAVGAEENSGIRLRVQPASPTATTGSSEEEERLRKRASSSFGDVSGTDSEWDKVSEGEVREA